MLDGKEVSIRISVLMAALGEANTAVRAYDTKAQIAVVGYIFSLGIAGQLQTILVPDATLNTWKVVAFWLIFMIPILQFGLVLYPSRATLNSGHRDDSGILYIEDNPEISEAEFVEAVRQCDPFNEVCGELLRVSQLRHKKRKRFVFGLGLTMLAYFALFVVQILVS